MKTVAFSLVLNGMPFIKKQFEIIPELFDEWYIIEGAAAPYNCTQWCKPINAKYINSEYCSADGTFEFLNEKIRSGEYKNHKCKITIIRPPDRMWNGKLEMCNSIFAHIKEPFVLMEFDIDEIWSPSVLTEVLDFANNHCVPNGIQGMQFRCRCWVGPDIRITSRDGYADAEWDWRRLWIITTPTQFASHEPPALEIPTKTLNKDYTESRGWIFDHYSYALESQVEFKENYYGYANAVDQWKSLQGLREEEFPCKLNQYLKWTWGDTIVVKDNSQQELNQSILC